MWSWAPGLANSPSWSTDACREKHAAASSSISLSKRARLGAVVRAHCQSNERHHQRQPTTQHHSKPSLRSSGSGCRRGFHLSLCFRRHCALRSHGVFVLTLTDGLSGSSVLANLRLQLKTCEAPPPGWQLKTHQPVTATHPPNPTRHTRCSYIYRNIHFLHVDTLYAHARCITPAAHKSENSST